MYSSDFNRFTTVAPINFKLGSPLPTPDTMWNDLDIHLPFCEVLFQTHTEAHDSYLDFPCIVKDSKFVFKNARGAKEYIKRAWRYLSENMLPGPMEETGPYLSSKFYSDLRNKEVFVSGLAGADLCRIFKVVDINPVLVDQRPITEQSVLSTELSSTTTPSDALFIIFRQGTVVCKIFMASREGQVPLQEALAFATKICSRIARWSGTDIWAKCSTPIKEHHNAIISAWQGFVVNFFKLMSAAHNKYPPVFLPEACGVCAAQSVAVSCKRCAGCRSIFYCGQSCQKIDWDDQHKMTCSLEFLLYLSNGKGSF